MEDEIGLKVFDVTSVTGEFAEAHPEVLRGFLKVTADANAAYADDADSRIADIAAEAGMSEEDTVSTLSTFSFPTPDQQKGDSWFGNDVPEFMNQVADLFVAEGALESKLDERWGME